MILEAHIEELRAELGASMDTDERNQIGAELAAAMQQHAAEEAALNASLSEEPPS